MLFIPRNSKRFSNSDNFHKGAKRHANTKGDLVVVIKKETFEKKIEEFILKKIYIYRKRENRGNYMDLLELIGSYDTILKNHLNKSSVLRGFKTI